MSALVGRGPRAFPGIPRCVKDRRPAPRPLQTDSALNRQRPPSAIWWLSVWWLLVRSSSAGGILGPFLPTTARAERRPSVGLKERRARYALRASRARATQCGRDGASLQATGLGSGREPPTGRPQRRPGRELTPGGSALERGGAGRSLSGRPCRSVCQVVSLSAVRPAPRLGAARWCWSRTFHVKHPTPTRHKWRWEGDLAVGDERETSQPSRPLPRAPAPEVAGRRPAGPAHPSVPGLGARRLRLRPRSMAGLARLARLARPVRPARLARRARLACPDRATILS